MTGRQIRDAAQAYVDEPIDDVRALYGINSGIAWIGPDAEVYDTATLEVSETTGCTATCPSNVIRILEIRDASGQLVEFTQSGAVLRLPQAGTYTMIHSRMPKPLSSITETPEIHEVFHPCLVTYLAAWFKLYDDDENPDGLRLMQKFERDVARAAYKVRRQRLPSSVRVIR